MRLRFAARAGTTYLREQEAAAPLKIVRPFELDSGRVLLQILNVGPGVLAGDRYRLEIAVETGAKVVLVNQAATKLHQAAAGQFASQNISFTVQDGAELEYYPSLTIPYAGSAFEQRIEVALDPDARFATVEPWAMGRVGHGEAFTFRRLSSRLRLSVGDTLRYADALELEPNTAPGRGLSDGYPYLAAGVCYGFPPWAPAFETSEQAVLATGQTDDGLGYLRALARDGLTLTCTVRGFLNAWRVQQGRQPIPFERFTS